MRSVLQYVCKDADYANEMAYLKKKVDAGAVRAPHNMDYNPTRWP